MGVLQAEVDGVVAASRHLDLSGERRVVVSIGSTPTAHVVRMLRRGLSRNLELELHAGEC